MTTLAYKHYNSRNPHDVSPAIFNWLFIIQLLYDLKITKHKSKHENEMDMIGKKLFFLRARQLNSKLRTLKRDSYGNELSLEFIVLTPSAMENKKYKHPRFQIQSMELLNIEIIVG